nr:alpha/beta fold hydrolase [Phycicoccus sp. CSK15P-2]
MAPSAWVRFHRVMLLTHDDVVELLDHLRVERATVVGSSLGGRVALELAAEHPERVERLVLLCPALRGLDPTPDVEAFGAEEADPPPGVRRVDVDPARVEVPALVVAGELDLDLFRTVAAHLADTMPRAELLTLPWAAHLPSLERPDEVTALLVGREA